MGGVELDFQCGGYCKRSKFYTFSDIALGPPTQTCVVSIEAALNQAQTYSLIAGLVFIITSFIGIVEAILIGICKKRNQDDDYMK